MRIMAKRIVQGVAVAVSYYNGMVNRIMLHIAGRVRMPPAKGGVVRSGGKERRYTTMPRKPRRGAWAPALAESTLDTRLATPVPAGAF